MRFRRRKGPLRSGRRRVRKLRLLAVLLLLGALAFASFTFGLVSAIGSEIPELNPVRQQKQEQDGYIYDARGKRILTVLRGSESRVLVRWRDIDPLIKLAIIAIEDKRFWEHRGVDLRGIGRALWADLREHEVVQGGSTITQQFVKNAYVKNEQAIGRKVKEAALSWQLEQKWTKPEILTAYLNTIYFGNGAYGVERAAVTYFGHGADELNLTEAALLAGIPKDPSRFDPATNPREAKERRNLVLREMFRQGLITRYALRKATRAPMPDPDDIRLPGTEGPAQYFVNYVKQQLVDQYGSARVFGGGLRVRTSIDLELQEAGRDAISKWLKGPTAPSAALVAIDTRDGRVLAMVGGKNYRESQFNLAVQGQRQPGSSFKPFVLAEALEQGISTETEFVSKPVVIPLGDRLWSVSNYEDAYLGPIDLETATIHSDNAVYAELTRLVGPAKVVRRARRLGITSPLEDYFSIGLGAQAVNPLEMARAFATFAKGGLRVDNSLNRLRNRPRAILQVRSGASGRVDRNRPKAVRVVDPRTASVVSSLLQKVVQQGTGRRAALPDGRPVAGKTGTTENYGDAWFVGYTPQIAVAVWVGHPNELRPMLTSFHGEPVAGGTFPALIWKSFMERAVALKEYEPEPFSSPPAEYAVPRTVVPRDGEIQVDNGRCRATRTVWYVSGSGPAKTADCKPNEVEVPTVVGESVETAEARLEAQPLTPNLVVRPAEAKEPLNVILRQHPKGGTLSSFDEVTIVAAKPTHGVVPRVVGLPLRSARRKLARLQLEAKVVEFAEGKPGTVLFQIPRGGVAAAPGLDIKLVVARA